MCVHEIWIQDSKRKSGAKIGYGVSGGTMDEYAKSQIIYEQMEFVKKLFLREIKNTFRLWFMEEKRIFWVLIFSRQISICPLSNAYIYQLQQYGGVIHPRQI